ncbi:MAG: PIG-L family deacetylase, partial [Luteibaculum sp.]
MRKLIFVSLFLGLAFFSSQAQNPSRTVLPTNQIFLELKQLAKPQRVLYVAAHPDDENTRVISWLENTRNVETAYFSFTRGDGGQNLIGSEIGPLLGVLRTQELLEARKIDGGRQFFSHAIDFGYSKSAEETMQIWNEDQVLGDLVYVIRYFKPDVIITRFPPNAEAGHGHHAASAILAERAFDLAGDPTQYPEQLQRVAVWQPKRLAWNSYSWRRDPKLLEQDIEMNVGASIPLLGLSAGEIASQARSMHKCQGFGRSWNRGEITEYFKPVKGENFYTDVLEGINNNWSRFPEGAKVDEAFVKALRNFDFEASWKNIDELLAIKKALSKGENSFFKDAIAGIDRLIVACAQLHVEAVSDAKLVARGDSLDIEITAVAAEPIGASINGVEFSSGDFHKSFSPIGGNKEYKANQKIHVPEDFSLSNAYWLENEAQLGTYAFKDLALLEQAESEPRLTAKFKLQILSESFEVSVPVYHKRVESDYGERYEPLPVVDPVLLSLNTSLHIGIKSEPETISFEIENFSKQKQSRSLGISVPSGWEVEPSGVELSLEAGEKKRVSLQVKKLENAEPGLLKFFWNRPNPQVLQLQTVNYPHILKQYLQTGAVIRLSPVETATPGGKVGYIKGAGDEIPDVLARLGYTVVELNESNWDFIKKTDFKAIVTGIRAYNTQEWLAKKSEDLWDYAKNGGNVLVQYNTLNFLSEIKAPIAPTNLEIGRDRVTDENAEIKLLQPKHPIFNSPNKLEAQDFDNWVQERGLYFASAWSEDFEPLLEIKDPNE